VVRIEEPEGANFVALFDRSEDYAVLLADVAQVREALTSDTAAGHAQADPKAA